MHIYDKFWLAIHLLLVPMYEYNIIKIYKNKVNFFNLIIKQIYIQNIYIIKKII